MTWLIEGSTEKRTQHFSKHFFLPPPSLLERNECIYRIHHASLIVNAFRICRIPLIDENVFGGGFSFIGSVRNTN